MLPRTGLGYVCSRWSPSNRTPVPQSRITIVPLLVLTSTQDVLPPYRTVPGPGVAIDPRVPQNVIFIRGKYTARRHKSRVRISTTPGDCGTRRPDLGVTHCGNGAA